MRSGQLSLNQATTETASTVDVLEACRLEDISQVGLWRHKYVEGSVAATRAALNDHDVSVSSICRGGFFTGTRSERDAEADNRRAIDEAALLGAPVVVLVCGPLVDDIAASEAAIVRGIERLVGPARDAGVTLAIEPFHPMFLAERSAIVTLAQANRLVALFDDPTVGIALDTYHVWWDPALPAELAKAAGHLAAVHVADWLVPTTSLLQGRGLPGDGVIALGPLLSLVTQTGFDGPVEVEVLNAEVWSRPVRAVVADVRARMAGLFGEVLAPEETSPPRH